MLDHLDHCDRLDDTLDETLDDGLDETLDDGLTAGFWGTAPGWSAGGSGRRVHLGVDLGGPDPGGSAGRRRARVGLAVGSVVLAMPVLLAFRGGSDAPSLDGLRPAPSAVATASAPAAVTTVVAPPVEASPTEAAVAATPAPPAEAVAAPVAESSTETVTEPAVVEEPAMRVEVPCALEYTVVEGDYWLRLADASGAPLRDLLAVNSATIDTALYPGDEICLPAGATVPAPPPTPVPPSAAPSTPSSSSSSSGTRTTPTTSAPAPAPTAPPTTTPPTTAPPSPAAVQAIIREVWPDDLENRAIEIADRESNFLTTAKNWCCVGLFQIYWDVHKGWLDDLGVTSATQLYDARTNATAAYHLYLRSGGWGPWGF